MGGNLIVVLIAPFIAAILSNLLKDKFQWTWRKTWGNRFCLFTVILFLMKGSNMDILTILFGALSTYLLHKTKLCATKSSGVLTLASYGLSNFLSFNLALFFLEELLLE